MAGLQEVRDPVHGFIYLTKPELKIIDSRPFQRLRYIRQLALTYLVYPGAEHSRFSHSLGVMEVATRMFDTLMQKHQEQVGWDDKRRDRNRQLLRLAALLHDVGHTPFSHASEELLPDGDHERYSQRLMLGNQLAPLLEFKEHNINAETVSDFFSAQNIDQDVIFLRQILSGEVDADKLDYLYRDSIFTGVHYGRFDHQRLVQSLCLYEEPKEGNYVLAVEHGGLHALEAMVLARYFMFTQVYFHKTRRAYDYHLLQFLKRYVKQYPTDLDDYLECDDNHVFSLLRQHKEDDDARRILLRDPFLQAFTTNEHINDEERTRFHWLEETLNEKFGAKMTIHYDAAEKSPHRFRRVEMLVLDPNTNKPALVINQSGIISSLKNIEQYRVFVSEKHRKEVQRFCNEFWEQKKSHQKEASI